MAYFNNKRILTFVRLKEALRYDPATGIFYWKITSSPKAVVGSIAGMIGEAGYRLIAIDNEVYTAARLAWFYIHGELPNSLVDHINRDRADNRIANLRLASPSENLWNVGKYKTNTSGFKGVVRTKWGWQASISCKNKRHHLGSFQTAEEASAAYENAARTLHGEFASIS